mmetsp:Transcript_5053/g.10522  ORF Transcript_5053/g.10522 Transcript_5053/m.10522 type:complete len:612 (-) Transcript_5053:19-1854(-)
MAGLCHLSDSDSDNDLELKEKKGKPRREPQLAEASTSSTQAQENDQEGERASQSTQSASNSLKEKRNLGETQPGGDDDESTVDGEEAPGSRSKVDNTEGRRAQRRNAESDDLSRKARAVLMKIINYLHKHKIKPPQVLTVQFFKTTNGTQLRLNNSRVSARDIGYGPGLIWDDISPLVSGTDVHEDTRTEALNNALARNHCWFKIEKLERFEGREDNMIGSFEIHFNEEMTFTHSDLANARNESDESEGEASDDEDSDDEEHQGSPSKKKQKRKKGLTTDQSKIVKIIKRIVRRTSQTSAPRKVVYGKPLKGGSGVQIRVDDKHIPARYVHSEARPSLDAIRALTCNCDSIDQQTNVINGILEAAGCQVRVRKVDFTKAEESEVKVFGTFRIEMPKSGSPSLRRASTEAARDDDLPRRKSKRLQKETSFFRDPEHCRGSKRIRETDHGAGTGTLSQKASSKKASTRSSSENTQSNPMRERRRKADIEGATSPTLGATQRVSSSSSSRSDTNCASNSRSDGDAHIPPGQTAAQSVSSSSRDSMSNQGDASVPVPPISERSSRESTRSNNDSQPDVPIHVFREVLQSLSTEAQVEIGNGWISRYVLSEPHSNK